MRSGWWPDATVPGVLGALGGVGRSGLADHAMNCPAKARLAQITHKELAEMNARTRLNKAWISGIWAVAGGSIVLLAAALFSMLAK